MYGVVKPAESDGYRAHTALFDAEAAGRLYFAMRGIAYTGAPRPVLRHTTAPAPPVVFIRRR